MNDPFSERPTFPTASRATTRNWYVLPGNNPDTITEEPDTTPVVAAYADDVPNSTCDAATSLADHDTVTCDGPTADTVTPDTVGATVSDTPPPTTTDDTRTSSINHAATPSAEADNTTRTRTAPVGGATSDDPNDTPPPDN